MAGTLKKVRFKCAWQTYRVGDIIEPNGTLRDWLVSAGYVEIIDPGTVKAPVTRDNGPSNSRVRAAAKRLFS
jgi:hypothetical protein